MPGFLPPVINGQSTDMSGLVVADSGKLRSAVAGVDYSYVKTKARETFTGDGSTTIYDLIRGPADDAWETVYVGGRLVAPGTDYTLVGRRITFTSGATPLNGELIDVRYLY